MNPLHQRGMGLAHMIKGDNNYNNNRENADHRQSYFQQGPSLVETTLSRYNKTNNGDDTNKSNDVKTRKHPIIVQQHPYDKARNFLSQFPLGFLGCFNCVQLGHSNTRDCLNNRGDKFDKQIFFHKLWPHKPHKKTLGCEGVTI